jgi:hypothetical protein
VWAQGSRVDQRRAAAVVSVIAAAGLLASTPEHFICLPGWLMSGFSRWMLVSADLALIVTGLAWIPLSK